LVSLKRQEVSVLVAAKMSTLLPADSGFAACFPFSPELLKSLYLHDRLVLRQPNLRLNGNWLEEAGFSTDALVTQHGTGTTGDPAG